MNFPYLLKCIGAWFAMLLVSIANMTVRDFVYGPSMSELSAR